MSNPGNSFNKEQEIQQQAQQLWATMQGKQPALFDPARWQGRLMRRILADAPLKVDLLRFVEVFPSLHQDSQIQAHFQEYLVQPGRKLPRLLALAERALAFAPTRPLAAQALRKGIRDLAASLILAPSPEQALPRLAALERQGLFFTLDLLGEACLSSDEADHCQSRYLALLDSLTLLPFHPTATAPQGRLNVSLKLSALEPHLDPADLRASSQRLLLRLLPLLHRAKELGVFVNLDMEDHRLLPLIHHVFTQVAQMSDFRTWPQLGMVVQAYRKASGQELDQLKILAKTRGCPLSIRLVKGAYWDHEVIQAANQGRNAPVFTLKSNADWQYETLANELLASASLLQPAFASHNLRSLAHVQVMAKAHGLSPGAYELQMLYGMAEPLRQALVTAGERVRLYCPLGDLIPGLSYLVRRLLENSSNQGFLALGFTSSTEELRKLFVAPLFRSEPAPPKAEFANEAWLDFTQTPTCLGFQRALEELRQSLPLHAMPVIHGKARSGADLTELKSPNDPCLLLGRLQLATPDQGEMAMQVCQRAFAGWSRRPVAERGQLLRKLGLLLRRDRMQLAALECFESAKPWAEADADVAEAIDFCNFYALQAVRELGPQALPSLAGEENQLLHQGRGVAVILAPWNFPLAILTGMATAALAAGNPVLLKPSSLSPFVAQRLHSLMLEAGFPPEVVQYLPASGSGLGMQLVRHPQTAIIAFTGSKEVGLQIWQEAATPQPGQRELKKVILELGGKNAILVDEDADLDQAVPGVLASAFGYAGQKCSAASRVLVHQGIFDAFTQRLLQAVAGLEQAPAWEPGCQLNPVIDAKSQARLLALIQTPQPGAELLFAGKARQGGNFVPPAVFLTAEPSHFLFQQELFGPILTLMKVRDFAQGLDLAMNSSYFLTGAVYSRQPSHLRQAVAEFQVGNLYLNRPSTGAMVGRHPFGGFGMSGAGTKAGGAGYVSQFSLMRAVSENLTRRGFSPKLLL